MVATVFCKKKVAEEICFLEKGCVKKDTNTMKAFFKDTYIRQVLCKEDEEEKDQNKKFKYGCTKTWDLHHLHNVCIAGGRDGLYVGIEGVQNTWEREENAVDEETWNFGEGGKGEGEYVFSI